MSCLDYEHRAKLRGVLIVLLTETVTNTKHQEILRRVFGPDTKFDKPILDFDTIPILAARRAGPGPRAAIRAGLRAALRAGPRAAQLSDQPQRHRAAGPSGQWTDGADCHVSSSLAYRMWS
jgi:hypothetical protein